MNGAHNASPFGPSLSANAMFVVPAALTSVVASCAASCACCAAGAAGRALAARSARLAYAAFFSASLVLAWVLRLGAEPLVKHLPCEWCRNEGREGAGARATARGVPQVPAWREGRSARGQTPPPAAVPACW